MSRENFDTKGKKRICHTRICRPFLGYPLSALSGHVRRSFWAEYRVFIGAGGFGVGGVIGCVLCGVVVDLSLRPVVERRGENGGRGRLGGKT